MKTKMYIGSVVILVALVVTGFFVAQNVKAPARNNQPQIIFNDDPVFDEQKVTDDIQEPSQQLQAVHPLADSLSRITKKPFGIHITAQNSPVQPERFAGYHTGVDLETTIDEQNIEVRVRALCDGKLLSVRNAGGYGGVAVQSCNLNDQAVTVVYGHINVASVEIKIGDQLKAGDFLANLGAGYSAQTDGERKHLHLGIRKGAGVNILGYVKSKALLSSWLDPQKFLN